MDKKTYDNIIDEMARLAKLEHVTDAYNTQQTAHLPYAKLKLLVDKIYKNVDHGNIHGDTAIAAHTVADTLLQLLTVPYTLVERKL